MRLCSWVLTVRCGRRFRLAVLAFIMTLTGGEAHADAIPYRDNPIRVESETLRAEFRRVCPVWYADSKKACPWGLVVTSKISGKRLYSGRGGGVFDNLAGPSGRLTHLWISPDERYVVALSYVQWNAGPQILVVASDGSIAAKRVVDCGDAIIPNCRGSGSYWYRMDNPVVRILEHRGQVVGVELNTYDWARTMWLRLSSNGHFGNAVPERFVVPLNCALTETEHSVSGLEYCSERALSEPVGIEKREDGGLSEQSLSTLLQWLARRPVNAGKAARALPDLDLCLAHRPDDCSCMLRRAGILRVLDRPDDALAQLVKAEGRCW